MALQRDLRALSAVVVSVAFACAPQLPGQSPATTLPATPPTSASAPGTVPPLAAFATPADHPGAHHHRAEVSCAHGELEVHADNSSLNGILRSVAHCTGMKITGGVLDQRVFGDYGPAAPATVLATLLDGTGSNMLLQETAADQPAELILTSRTGGPTPPAPSLVPDDDEDAAATQPGTAPAAGSPAPVSRPAYTAGASANASAPNPNVTPVPQPLHGSVVTTPVSIPQPLNNVNGSPNNASPTAGNYPTTNSVPLDSLPTPSTTPAVHGIVDSPNPPAPGSDTAKLLNGSTSSVPGTTTIVDTPTSSATSPGGTNTTTPVPTGSPQPGTGAKSAQPTGVLTPQQVYDQLQQMRQAQTGTAASQGSSTSPQTPTQTPASTTPTPASTTGQPQ